MATGRARLLNPDVAYGALTQVLATRTTEYWMALCEANDVPATRIARLDDIIAGLPTAEHPVAGTYRQVPHPVRFSKTPAGIRRHAPLIGEHTEEIRAEVRGARFRPNVQQTFNHRVDQIVDRKEGDHNGST